MKKKITIIILILCFVTMIIPNISTEKNTSNILNDENLVGYWSFNEGTDSIVYDSSGNNNHGTIHSASWTTGIEGSALYFDGFDDYVTIPDAISIDLGTGDFSICTWIKTDIQTTDKYQIIEKMDRSGQDIGFYLRVTDMQGYSNRIESAILDEHYTIGTVSYSETQVNDNQWHFIVSTYDRSNLLTTYIDGLFENSIGISHMNGNINTNTPLYIGRQDNNKNHFSGIIDEIRIYNKVLTEDEISDLYTDFIKFHSLILFGKINNLQNIGNLLIFEAEKLRMITFNPLQFIQYTNNEKIVISKDYIGILNPNFICALCKTNYFK